MLHTCDPSVTHTRHSVGFLESGEAISVGSLLSQANKSSFAALVEGTSTTTVWWEVTSVVSKAVRCRQPSHLPWVSGVETHGACTHTPV